MAANLLQELIHALQCLPGVGPKSAQRMAFQLLERERDKGLLLADTIKYALKNIDRCDQCRTFTELNTCELCTSPRRKRSQLCIVESPADVFALEQTNSYQGVYFVLMGRLSPLDGIGPKDIGIDLLTTRINQNEITEMIIATNPTIEGEATAHYLANLVKDKQIKTSRLATGIPAGGELEYIDQLTLSRAFQARVLLSPETA